MATASGGDRNQSAIVVPRIKGMPAMLVQQESIPAHRAALQKY